MPRGEAPSEFRRLLIPLAVIGVTGALATAAAGATTEIRSHKGEGLSPISFGFTDGFLLTGNQNVANNEAAAIKAANGNKVIVVYNFTNGSADTKNTITDLCVADKAAYENGLGLGIRFQGYFKPKTDKSSQTKAVDKFKLGYIPDYPNELKRFDAIVGSILHGLAGERNPDGSGGCVPENKDITLLFPNEFNSRRFSRVSLTIAAQRAARLMKYEYTHAHAEAQKPGLNVDLKVEGPEISTSPWNHPEQAVKEFATASGGVLYSDAFTYHLYAGKNDVQSSNPGADNTIVEQMTEEILNDFGPNVTTKITELGGNSYTKPVDSVRYTVEPGSVVFGVGKLAKFYCNTYKKAQDNDVAEIDGFHLIDDSNDIWRSGWALPYKSASQTANVGTTTFKPGKNLLMNATGMASSGQPVVC